MLLGESYMEPSEPATLASFKPSLHSTYDTVFKYSSASIGFPALEE